MPFWKRTTELGNTVERLRKNDTTLIELRLQHRGIGDEGVSAIAKALKDNTTLTELSLRDNKIGDAGAVALAAALEKSTTLAKLDLRENNIENKGARALAKALKENSTLTVLNLQSNKIGDEGAGALADALEKITRLTKLVLNNNQIGDDTVEQRINKSLRRNKVWHTVLKEPVKRLVRNDRALTKLGLRKESIEDEGARALADALKQNTTLTHLDLYSNSIGADGARALADALKQNTTLTNLNLRANDIGPEGARALADALEKNTTLTSLDLACCYIGADGARALADALEKNTTLTNLTLENYRIGTEGARALAAALEKNSTLTFLDLAYCYIGDVGARAIANALEKNTTLTYLNLYCNTIGADGARALADALEKNTTLTRLEFRGNNTEHRDYLEKLVYRNLKAAVIAKAEAVPKVKLTEEEKRVWEREKYNRVEKERKRKIKLERERNEAEAKAKKKAEEEEKKKNAEEEAKKGGRTTVPIIEPGNCTVMISFNDYSAGEDAETLANYLTSNGIPTFCTRVYCPSMVGSWREVTIKGAVSCKYYLMLLTNGWQKSNECQYETEIAINRKAKREVTLVPVWYEDFDPDFDKKGGLDREGNSVEGKSYQIQFHAIQSIYRKSDSWMQDILKQLGGVEEVSSLVNGNTQQAVSSSTNGKTQQAADPNLQIYRIWTLAAVAVVVVATFVKFLVDNQIQSQPWYKQNLLQTMFQ